MDPKLNTSNKNYSCIEPDKEKDIIHLYYELHFQVVFLLPIDACYRAQIGEFIFLSAQSWSDICRTS